MTDKAEYDRKLAAALAELRATGMWRANYDPHMDRALRRLGLRLRPPHYRSFLSYMFGVGGCFGILWGIQMLQMPQDGARSSLGVSLGALVGGLIFGGLMALWLRRDRRKHRLRDWDML
jgi:membrane associated rhomboid family serine protease